ncbi:MAG: DUF6119 family protein [Parachlamydiales bacterium]
MKVLSPAEVPFEGVNIYLLKQVSPPKGPEERILQLVSKGYSEMHAPPQWQGPFQVKLFQLQTEHLSSFAKALLHASPQTKKGAVSSTSTNLVGFLWQPYEPHNLFAITTGMGYNLIKPHANPHFSTLVASRIINPRQITWANQHSLKGSTEMKISSHVEEAPYSLQGNELFSIASLLKRFLSEFCVGSSLHARLQGLPERVKVEFSRSSLQIHYPLTMPQFQIALGLFADIAEGRETRNRKGEQELPQAGFRYLDNISKVPKKGYPLLDQSLVKLLWKSSKLAGWSLSYPNHLHYQRTSHFSLCYEDKQIDLDHHPSWKEMIDACKQLLGNREEIFIAHFFSIKVRFGQQTNAHSIRQLLRGELNYQGEAYYLRGGSWCVVREDYLPALHRDFYDLLFKQGALLKPNEIGALPKPWYAKEEWVSFTAKEASIVPSTPNAPTSDEILRALTKGEWTAPLSGHSVSMRVRHVLNFSFVASDGGVLVPYLTRAVLELADRSLKSKLKKRFTALSDLLKTQRSLDTKALTPLFQGQAESVLTLLKQQRPVLKEAKSAKQSFCLVSPEGEVLYPYVTRVTHKSKADAMSEHYRIAIERLLIQKWERKEAVTLEEVKTTLDTAFYNQSLQLVSHTSKPRADAKDTIWNWLTNEEVKLNGDNLGLVAVGPITIQMAQTLSLSQPMIQFFQAQHQRYREVVEEEGYNRLYLEQQVRDFLVCDQVFPSGNEKIELFDLLYYGDPNQLFLYAVKSGFNHKTEQACNQIYLSACALFNRRDEILVDLFNSAINAQNLSPFRQQVCQILTYGLPEPGTAWERFRRLFDRPITFVYALLDEHVHEDLLSEEKDPGREFVRGDFGQGVFDNLVKQGYLDSKGRVTRKLLTTPQTKFPAECGGKEVHKLLNPTHFNSVMAKLALVKLAASLKEMGFGFKICQIQRRPPTSPPKIDLVSRPKINLVIRNGK